MRPVRAGVPVGHFHASRPEAAGRRAAPEYLHRLRTLRRGLSDRLGPARRLSRGKSASRGSRRASLARADAGAVPLPALEPRVHIVSRSRAGARDDRSRAAHRAPTASNLQQVAFTLVTDPDTLRRITAFTVETFASVVRKLENPLLKPLLKVFVGGAYRYLPNFHRLIGEYGEGRDLILRGATAVLLIHTPDGSRFGCQDSNLAYQNASLMAESLGVSQFYTGFGLGSAAGTGRTRPREAARNRREDPCRHGDGHAGFPVPQLRRSPRGRAAQTVSLPVSEIFLFGTCVPRRLAGYRWRAMLCY